MDVSAFEAADRPSSNDIDEAAILDLLHGDPAVLAMLAVMKHVFHLALLVATLALCAALWMFVLAWLCLFWLQTRLFYVTGKLLRSVMVDNDQPLKLVKPYVHGEADEKTHIPEPTDGVEVASSTREAQHVAAEHETLFTRKSQQQGAGPASSDSTTDSPHDRLKEETASESHVPSSTLDDDRTPGEPTDGADINKNFLASPVAPTLPARPNEDCKGLASASPTIVLQVHDEQDQLATAQPKNEELHVTVENRSYIGSDPTDLNAPFLNQTQKLDLRDAFFTTSNDETAPHFDLTTNDCQDSSREDSKDKPSPQSNLNDFEEEHSPQFDLTLGDFPRTPQQEPAMRTIERLEGSDSPWGKFLEEGGFKPEHALDNPKNFYPYAEDQLKEAEEFQKNATRARTKGKKEKQPTFQSLVRKAPLFPPGLEVPHKHIGLCADSHTPAAPEMPAGEDEDSHNLMAFSPNDPQESAVESAHAADSELFDSSLQQQRVAPVFRSVHGLSPTPSSLSSQAVSDTTEPFPPFDQKKAVAIERNNNLATAISAFNHPYSIPASPPPPAPTQPQVTKREATQARKAAREALTEAWVDREDARRRVPDGWTLERAQDLEEKNKVYLEKRQALASLMASGKLSGEYAQYFPYLSNGNLDQPRFTPPAAEHVRRMRREARGNDKEADERSSATSKDENEHEAQPATSPEADELSKAIQTLQSARKLYLQTLNTSRGPPTGKRTQWLKRVNESLERATKYYRGRRLAVAGLLPDGWTEELLEEFPEV